MSLKNTFMHAAISATPAIAACIIYNRVYSAAFEVNFNTVLNIMGIIGSCIFACVLMAFAYFFGIKWKGERITGWINLLISVLSFVSIIGILGFQLPLDVEFPEMFPGLAIPMHFFPALSFFSVAPFFRQN